MRVKRSGVKHAIVSAAALAFVLTIGQRPAAAATISWATWTSSTTGNPGAASGTTDLGVMMSYVGELEGLFSNYPSWGPAGTFNGGTVDNAPPITGGIIQLYGGNTNTNTLFFSAPVVNPILAIWSLGQGGLPASFNFTASEPFTIESGGGANEYGGSTIYAGPNVVFGEEGNGTVQFDGTFTSISWTNPVAENWYGFTAGITAIATDAPAPVPEPASMFLIGSGLVGGAVRRWRKSRMNA